MRERTRKPQMKGELGTFSAAEILQLIGMQEKTGILRIRSKGRMAALFFDSGKIVSARDRREGFRDPFLLYLQENGEIGVEDLNRILEIRKNDGGDLIEIMLREKVIEDKRLGELLGRYALQIVANIIKWEKGTYEFSASTDGLPEKAISKPLRLEPILLEALRRKDEVEQIRRFLPGFDTRLRMSEPTTDDLPLEKEELAVLRLVDGRRAIDEVIEESDLDEVETLDTLEKLFALGIVSIAEETQHTAQTRSVSTTRFMLLTAAIVTASIVLRFGLLAPSSPDDLPVAQVRNTVENFIESREIRNLQFALDAHKYLYGIYPQDLGDLASLGLIDEDGIKDRYGRTYPYRYFTLEDRYMLSP
jgi:hypothetical protein